MITSYVNRNLAMITRLMTVIPLMTILLSQAQNACAEEIDPAAVPLESLMSLKVTSVSKKSQQMTDAAAAVFVITQDDIRRSGATNIPDLLRMVPGVQVARIDSSKWAVSARGFNGRFSNKMLVLKDGRALFTPLFLGVYWETQDTILEDVDRIEVIRGPGASLWGANAVNGVINIITKNSDQTHGGMISAGAGDYEKIFANMRYGESRGGSTSYRIHARHLQRNNLKDSSGMATHDSWFNSSAGFRIDSTPSAHDRLTFQGDIYSGKVNEKYNLYKLPQFSPPPYLYTQESCTDISGVNLIFRWQKKLSESSSFSLQTYYDHDERNMLILPQVMDNFDIDLQHRFTLGTRQDIVWGAGYRLSSIKLQNSSTLSMPEERYHPRLLSSFIHDEITISPNRLALIVGARLEHNDTTGFEFQPNGRLIWTPNPQNSIWAAVSRAVRTPTVGDQQIIYRYRSIAAAEAPTTPLPLRLEILGSRDMQSEKVIAYEIGYRTEVTNHLSSDISVFYNDYTDLRVLKPGAIYAEPQGGPPINLVQPFLLSNDMHGYAYGWEASLEWQPLEWWRLKGAYSFEKLFMSLEGTSTDQINKGNASGDTPRQQLSVRSGMELGNGINLDLWLRCVERIDWIDGQSMPGYSTLDARVSWKPTRDLELALTGQNLFHDHRPEFVPEYVNSVPSETVRSFYAKATWRFR